MGKVIARIPLTGGPKGGKTKIKEAIRNMIESEYGYKVFVVPETATEIINGGFIPIGDKNSSNERERYLFRETNIAFQQMILNMQIAKEQNYEIAAVTWPEDSVIIYDRGIMDNLGYLVMNLGEEGYKLFDRMLSEYNLTVEEIMKKYDAVLSLESSAKITSFANNADDTTIRIEADELGAMRVDKYVSAVWENHQNYQRITATEDFQEKINAVLEAIRKAIGGRAKKMIL